MTKKLTLKQLYGYSIMDWEQFLDKIKTCVIDRECSFCRDSGSNYECEYCRIDKDICNEIGRKGIYKDVWEAERVLYSQVKKIIDKLRENYKKADKRSKLIGK